MNEHAPNSTSLPFIHRHLGPSSADVASMLKLIGVESLEDLADKVVPTQIRTNTPLDLPPALSEVEVLAELRSIASKNEVFTSHIGMGYYATHTPPVIVRNLLENPAWYTAYTPYQAEISQGRLEALFHFQTVISELTGLEVANASLLDEGTAAAEAVAMMKRSLRKNRSNRYLVSHQCHPQTIDVIQTRALRMDLDIEVVDLFAGELPSDLAGVVVSYPNTDGSIDDFTALAKKVHKQGGAVICVADLLALTILKEPGAWGADVVVGNTQRFGVPMGYGGPHAAYMATRQEHVRQMPGRIVGQSVDKEGNVAWRLAVQTREQHIRRQKATSNICTSQVLLANAVSMFAVYHGPEGLTAIGRRIHRYTTALRAVLQARGTACLQYDLFDTIKATLTLPYDTFAERAKAAKRHFRRFSDTTIGISCDETTTFDDLVEILSIVTGIDSKEDLASELNACLEGLDPHAPLFSNEVHSRTTSFLQHEVFQAYRTETEFLRYLNRLQRKDYSLADGMIPLGSCTMKLNATAEMIAMTWPEFANLHPFAPQENAAGYTVLFQELEQMLSAITGLEATSLQPNSGAAGEYAGMLTIRRYLQDKKQEDRTICLIPESAHGTNPASAAMAGLDIKIIRCNEKGDLDLSHLKELIEKHHDTIAAIMITYPSTHGVFEQEIVEVCKEVHNAGGLVYLDGANMNAQVGLCRPGDFGADVVHFNLHKTFAMPHGGGGPGLGPICVREFLRPFLPGHAIQPVDGRATGAVASAPYGSAGISMIAWAYIRLLGSEGLRQATIGAILSANYIAKRLGETFPVLYQGAEGFVAHECILDPRAHTSVSVTDIAKRLMDYGFHAPTVSFPVAGTLMVEPTESESLAEIDRFCDALLSIHKEIELIESGVYPADDNPLVNAPHTAAAIATDEWTHPYSRQVAVAPGKVSLATKFWPSVSRIDEAAGDRTLVCCIARD